MARNVAAIVTMLLGMTAVVQAQDAALAELYGNGVHAFHAGDYKDAHTSLNQAIKQGSKDPRCYFFRGLCYAKLGRPDEAKVDYKKAAELETTKAGKLYNVSRALARVQGKPRLQVEAFRRKARFKARNVRVSKNKARYGDLSKNEPNVIQSTPPGKVVIPKNTKQDKTNPFGGGTAAKGASSGANVSDPPKKAGTPAATTKKSPLGKTPPATTAKPPATTAKPPATTAKPPATTAKPPATTAKPPATTAKPPATTAKPPATTAKPPTVAGGKKSGGVTKALFSLFRGGGKAVADQAVGGDVNKLLKGAKSKPRSTGKKFKGSNEAPNPFGDTKKKK